jgi:hypothetical protein
MVGIGNFCRKNNHLLFQGQLKFSLPIKKVKTRKKNHFLKV